MTPEERRARFSAVHLYLVAPLVTDGRTLLDIATHAVAGGVDAIQLRDKIATDAELVAGLRGLRQLCDITGTLLVLNDRPDLAVAGGADAVHVGQDDVPVDEARGIVGEDLLIGLSTHSKGQIDLAHVGGASGDPEAVPDHIGVGPIHDTPTKAGAKAVGVDLIPHAAAGELPFVAIGGIDAQTIHAVLKAGAPRVAVVRAIAEADDPRAAASLLRGAVDARR
ncbi:thiamine phosphate synthase [Patulibacter sp.]|uniref:thiamine phosphate synthase n=1 Tax=Patulibacter sp. TaxID=1912859 RepID=UPI0027177068|nr:thiamine phosphate synthase [Patulibacter sp.]MDO9407600.1 thiamine phosphate synthase [Patulibacter sp.]